MFERIETFEYENENIHSIIHEPDQNYIFDKKIMIVFLHGWAGYRVGPHNILVEIARYLSEKGFYCCRFDFRGRGFSDGNCEVATTQTMLADLEVVLTGLREKYKPYHIILLGICIGAKLAIYYARNGNQEINNVIEISSNLLVENNKNIELRIKKASYVLISYFYKFFLKETWNKLLTNQINFKLIIKRIIKPNSKKILEKSMLEIFFEKKTDYHAPIIKNIINKNASKKMEYISNISTTGKVPFSNFNGEILSIHGQYDPEAALALKQIKYLCKKNKIKHSFTIISKANHNFYSIKWKKEIIEFIGKWLDNKYLS